MPIEFDFSTARDEEEEDIIPLEAAAARPGGIDPAQTDQELVAPKKSFFATEEEEQANEGRGPNYSDVAPVTDEFDFSSAKDEEPPDFDFTSAETSAHPVGIVTAYRPGGDASMGLNAGIEGGNVDAHDTPIIGRTTMEDYLAGNGDYVTVAMDKNSSWQGQFLSSPSFPDVVFQVRDNGGFGNGKTGENWIDIAYTDPQKAKSLMLRGVPFTPITPEQAQAMSASRPDIDHTPRLQALYVPGGSFSYKEDTGLPDPFMEFGARTARGVETGTREMFGGALSMVEAGARGERNVYLDEEEPQEKAQGDIPLLEEQIATLQQQMRDQILKDDPSSADWLKDTTLDSPELQKLDKQLKQARRAKAGDLTENVLGQLSRQTERLAIEAEQNQASAMKKYQPFISASRDTQWGFKLADALGMTVPGVLASIGNPIFGAATIYAQIYQGSLQQYMAQKPEATREQAQKFANDQALAQTPWAIAGNQLTARALKASFAALPAGAVERGARIFGTQLGQAVAKNAQAFIGNVGSAIGQSMMSDMVSEDYDLLEDTDLGEKFARSMEPAALAGGVSAIFGVGGLGVAAARRPGARPKAEAAPKEAPAEPVTVGAKALPAPEVSPIPKMGGPAPGPLKPAHGAWAEIEARFNKLSKENQERIGKLPLDEWEAAIAEVEIKKPIAPSKEVEPPKALPAPEEKAAPAAAKPAGFLKLDKPAIDQDFGPEWKTEVANAYEAIKTGKSYITEVTGTDMFMHFAKDFPGDNWRQDTANFMRRQFGIEGVKFTKDGKEHTVHFKEKPPEKFSREERDLSLAIPRPPPIPGAPRPPAAALPPSQSIVGPVPQPKGIGPTIAPLFQNPIHRSKIQSSPGNEKSFWKFKTPIKNFRRFWIGTAEVFESAPGGGLKGLGQAIRNYIDDNLRLNGRDTNPFRLWEKSVTAKQKAQGLDEFYRFFLQADDPDVNVQKQAIPTYWAASDKGRELIDLTRDYFNRTGIENQQEGVQVYDPKIQKWRPIGRIGAGDPIPQEWYPGWKAGYFPRMVDRDIMKILRNPKDDPAAYQAVLDEMTARGFNSQEAQDYISHILRTSTSNDYFGSLDLARTLELPTKMNDYSFETVRRYISARNNRLAQIKNFGQKMGPGTKDLFEQYHDIAGDDVTRKYINHVRNQVFNTELVGPFRDSVRGLGTALTGMHLGNWRTAFRNLMSGQAMIATQYGIKRYAKGVIDSFDNINDANEKGIMLHDLFNLSGDGDNLGGRSMIQKGTDFLLKWSGELPAENFNRVVNMGAAKALLRDAIAEYRTDPFSKQSRKYFGHFKRLGGIDPQALIDEGGAGPLTGRYLRQSVKRVQGGYQIDQVPAFMETDVGRFFLKYNKWGTQQTDFFVKEVIRPAVRSLTLGKAKQETVEIRNPVTGQMETKQVPGDLKRAAAYFILLAGAGWMASQFDRHALGIEDSSESLAEIITKLDKDGQAAFFAVLGKLWQYQLVMGIGGAVGNYAQVGYDWTERTRFKDPFSPPALEFIKSSGQFVMDSFNQKGFTLADVDGYLRKNLSSYRTGKQLFAYLGNDVYPLGFRALQAESMRQDLTWMRAATKRFEKESGIKAPPGGPPSMGKNPMTPFNRNLNEALLLGDYQEARALIFQRLKGLPVKTRETVMESIKDSVRARRPIKAGGSTSEAAVQNFIQWAEKNMSKVDAAKIRRIDKTYTRTAELANILGTPKVKTDEDIREQLRRMQMRTEMRKTR